MELYPLTKPQLSIWNMEQFYGGSIANITGSAIFYEDTEITALHDAINTTLAQSDALRIRIVMQDSVPMQYVDEYKPAVLRFKTFQPKRILTHG